MNETAGVTLLNCVLIFAIVLVSGVFTWHSRIRVFDFCDVLDATFFTVYSGGGD